MSSRSTPTSPPRGVTYHHLACNCPYDLPQLFNDIASLNMSDSDSIPVKSQTPYQRLITEPRWCPVHIRARRAYLRQNYGNIRYANIGRYESRGGLAAWETDILRSSHEGELEGRIEGLSRSLNFERADAVDIGIDEITEDMGGLGMQSEIECLTTMFGEVEMLNKFEQIAKEAGHEMVLLHWELQAEAFEKGRKKGVVMQMKLERKALAMEGTERDLHLTKALLVV